MTQLLPLPQLLPMTGRTHGHRSAVTCALKCDSACARPVPNPSTEASFADVASAALLSRRRVLAGAGVLAVAAGAPTLLAEPAAAVEGRTARGEGRTQGPFSFTPIESVSDDVDALTIPAGFS